MKKNKLYTVNRYNRTMFMPEEKNLYSLGNYLNKAGDKLGGVMGGGKLAGSPVGGLVSGLGSAVGGLANNLISGDYKSGAGSAISGIGGTVGSAISAVNPVLGGIVSAGSGIVGGAVNALFGQSVDEEALKDANEGTAAYNNFQSNASSLDDVKGPTAQANVRDVYKDGLFGGDADEKNEALRQQRRNARQWAFRSVDNNINNLVSDQMNNALAGYFAYGGPMDFGGGALGLMQQNRYFDTIDKRSEAIAGKGQTMQTGFTGGATTFADGGLKASFLDEFGKDPIAAAVRYNQGLEAIAAQREAEEAEAAREADYTDMQKRLLSLETQNQGLQALMAAQSIPSIPETTEETAEPTPSSSSPSAAAYNSNWDYIEDQLKRSGKFNDVQIQGIKYNLQRESGIGQYDGGDNGTARGLAQWRGNRIPKDMSLEGQTKYLIDTLSNYDGKLHWVGEDNYRGFMNARTPEEAHYYIARGYERPASNIIAKVKRDSDMSLKNLSAFGGNIEEPQDNTRVSKPAILPIKRERGFSDSEYFWNSGIQYPAGLWKHKDGTFHTSDSYGNDIMLTPEEADSIVRANKEKDKNERIRRVIKNNALAFGGELGTNGTDFTNGLLYIDEGGSHEENPLEGVPMGLDPQGIPNLVEEGETVYNDYVFSDRMKVPFFMYKELGLGGVMKKKGKEMSFADASKKLAQESEQRPNDPISQDGLEASLAKLAEVQEAERMRKQGKEYMGLEGYACGGKIGNKYKNGSNFNYGGVHADDSLKERIKFDPEKAAKELEEVMGKREATPAITDAIRQGAAMQGYNPDMGLGAVVSQYNPEQEDNPKTYDTWMRYAPAVGAGVMTLTDMLGLTNRPDYTYASKLEAAAERAGYAPNIDYKPIGNYITYRPMDIWYEQNRTNALSRTTDRNIMNTSGGNRGTAMAGLLANSYNSQLASGNLYRQALEYNDAKRKDVAEFNRKTNMFNSQMDLEAAMANARYQQAARQMGLSGLAQAAALRDSIDARVGASRSANLTNFLTSLGNIGRENFALNQINWDRSRHYGTDASGRSSYKRKNK